MMQNPMVDNKAENMPNMQRGRGKGDRCWEFVGVRVDETQ